MASEERREGDLYIRAKRKSKAFFVTSSAKMDERDGVSKTTISSSVFTEMSNSFAEGNHLLNSAYLSEQGPILYMLQQIETDLDAVYNEVSASAFQSSYFPFALMDSCSIGFMSSSLIPRKQDKHNLGGEELQWKELYVKTINLNGTAITSDAGELNKLDGFTGTVTDLNYLKTLRATAVTNTEFDYLDGVTSAIQTQLNARLSKSGGAMTGAITTNSTFDGVDIATRDAILTSTTTTAKAALPKTGGTMTGLIRPIAQTINGAKLANPHDVRAIDIIEITAGGKAWTLTTARSAHVGQKLTIIALTAGKVVHGRGNAATQFQCVGGRDLAVAINTAVTFISNSNGLWYQQVV